MSGFEDSFPDQEYQKIIGSGNTLGEIRDVIDWEKFRPILSDMHHDNKEIGGRPHPDEILMIKMLILAGWHRLSDYWVELLAIDRLSLWHFLGYPDKISERSTIWLFKKKLMSKGKIYLIWEELQRQLDAQGYSIKRGTS
jgi:IS5 family transposase